MHVACLEVLATSVDVAPPLFCDTSDEAAPRLGLLILSYFGAWCDRSTIFILGFRVQLYLGFRVLGF